MKSKARLAEAERAIRTRFTRLEAALGDLAPTAVGPVKRRTIYNDQGFRARYENRVMTVLTLIAHFLDDARRLARRRGLKTNRVDAFVEQSRAISLCRRAAHAFKHGVGGWDKRTTVANALLHTEQRPQGRAPSEDDDCLVVALVLTDEQEGPHPSDVVSEQAIREWAEFFASEFALDVRDWVARCLPAPPGAVVRVGDGEKPSVPLGTTLVFGFPKEVSAALVEDVRKSR